MDNNVEYLYVFIYSKAWGLSHSHSNSTNFSPLHVLGHENILPSNEIERYEEC